MTTMALTISLVTAVILLLFLFVSHRRRILKLDVDTTSLPPIQNALTVIAGLTGGVVYEGNRVEIIQNGALLERMMDDIRRASHTVHLETYIWSRGILEKRLVDLLCSKVREGCTVRVLIDALGALHAHDRQLKRLRACGVELFHFKHFKGLNFYHFNNRMHRKLLVVDGSVAYTCGHGIADVWLGNAENKHHWRDTGVRLTGPVVHSIQSVFIQDWCSVSKKVPLGRGCFPKQYAAGTVQVHTVKSSTRATDSSVAMFYMLAIASARKEVLIQNPYFIPNGYIPDLLMDKARAGVRVHLMLPGRHNDVRIARLAGRRLYQKLLDAGVRIYEFGPTMMHQKILVIDGVWSHVGTTNFDLRSLALNAEIGVGILDQDTAAQLRKAFMQDLKRSQVIDPECWKSRTGIEKLLEWMAYQVRAQI